MHQEGKNGKGFYFTFWSVFLALGIFGTSLCWGQDASGSGVKSKKRPDPNAEMFAYMKLSPTQQAQWKTAHQILSRVVKRRAEYDRAAFGVEFKRVAAQVNAEIRRILSDEQLAAYHQYRQNRRDKLQRKARSSKQR